MESVTLNPAGYGIVNIDSVGKLESIPVKYEVDGGWPDEYAVSVWNSDKKNTLVIENQELTKAGNALIWQIEPEADGLAKGSYYYEIVNKTMKHREIIGDLKISE